VISGLVASCNGGLMATTIADEHRGTAGAAYNIGNISFGGIVAWILIWLHAKIEPWALALITVVLMVMPAFAVLAIAEPPRERPKQVWRPMLRGVGNVLFSKSGITGILLMLSPVGTAALTNSFTAMNDDYHTSDSTAGLLNGPIVSALTAIGSWIGGWLCDRHSRRAMYLLSGILTAIVALGIARSAQTREVYLVGVSIYGLVTGFCFASFTATVLETIGHGDAAAGTKYTLFTAAGNVAIAYTNLVDTRAYEHWGNSNAALFTSDAMLNIGGAALLAFVFWRLRTFGASKHPPELVVSTASEPEPEPELPVARIHDE
jgi:MFS family permease